MKKKKKVFCCMYKQELKLLLIHLSTLSNLEAL